MTCIAPSCQRPPTVGALFCEEHITAPPGRRGGWLSAHRRKLAMVSRTAAHDRFVLDASNILPRLWIGSAPPVDRELEFDVLVLCAREMQPTAMAFRGNVVRVPMPDGILDTVELAKARAAANVIGRLLVTGGKKILVTSTYGRNRPALVAGLALGSATRMSSTQIVELIRDKRSVPDVLSNETFVAHLSQFVGGGRRGR